MFFLYSGYRVELEDMACGSLVTIGSVFVYAWYLGTALAPFSTSRNVVY